MSYYKILIAFCFLCASISLVQCGSTPTDKKCNEFKTGKYKYRVKSGKTRLLTRSHDRETQVMHGFTDTLYLGVQWLNDCEYELIYLDDYEKKVPDSLKDFARAHPVHVKIIETSKDYYICTQQQLGSPNVLRDTFFSTK